MITTRTLSTRVATAVLTLLMGASAQARISHPLRLKLDMVDGSRIIGVPAAESLRFRTSYAELDIPLKLIASVRVGSDAETASVESRTGDILTGALVVEFFELQTIVGKVRIRVDHITALRVMPGGSLQAWEFEGNDVDKFTMEGTGAFSEAQGKVSPSTYGAGADWHGPKATFPLGLPGDFRLAARINYQVGPNQIGRIRLGVTLDNGTTLFYGIGSSHVATVDHTQYFHHGDEAIWSTGRKIGNEKFMDHPVALERIGNVLRCFVNDQLVETRRGCDESAVKNVFFSIERFQTYSALTEASISRLTVQEIGK